MASNYTPGDMEIGEQSRTYIGFIKASMICGALLIVILLYPILVFAAGQNWFGAIPVCFVVGVLIGLVLKFRAWWYATLVLMAGATAFFGWLFGLLF